MRLSPTDKAFVQRREKRAKYWPFFGAVLLTIVVAYGAWLWLKLPHLINPWRVMESLEAGTISESTMEIMAAMLPIVMAAFLVFMFVVVLLWFISFNNERRLIRLVRELEADAESDGARG
jgi:hypothetical protein